MDGFKIIPSLKVSIFQKITSRSKNGKIRILSKKKKKESYNRNKPLFCFLQNENSFWHVQHVFYDMFYTLSAARELLFTVVPTIVSEKKGKRITGEEISRFLIGISSSHTQRVRSCWLLMHVPHTYWQAAGWDPESPNSTECGLVYCSWRYNNTDWRFSSNDLHKKLYELEELGVFMILLFASFR